MKCGEDVWISDGGDKEYRCQIEELGEDEVLLHILYAQEPEYELPNKLYLFQGLPKADKMELIIQKEMCIRDRALKVQLDELIKKES